MPSSPATPYPIFFKQLLRRVLEHWTPITVILAFLATGLSILTLYTYARAIGRTDLFMVAIDAKSSLAAWLLLVGPIMVSYLCVLTTTTWLYGFSVSMFSRCRSRINRAALWLLFPLVIGFSTCIVLVFCFFDRLGATLSVVIVSLATVVGLIAILPFKRFRLLVALSTSRTIKGDKFFFLFTLAGMLVCTVFSGLFSIYWILKTYVGADTDEAVWFVAMFTMGTLVLSLAPTFVFFTTKGSTYRRLAIGCAMVVVLFLAFLLLARGAMSSIAYAAAGNLEIRQTFSARFVLDEQISLADLDNVQWRTRLVSANRVEVEAFQLFAFGDVLLLCPSGLQRVTLHQLPRYTRLCLLTRSSKVERKPPRLRYPVQPKAKPSWQDHADRLVNWGGLSGQLDRTNEIFLHAPAPGA
jgi:hypothetical protein